MNSRLVMFLVLGAALGFTFGETPRGLWPPQGPNSGSPHKSRAGPFADSFAGGGSQGLRRGQKLHSFNGHSLNSLTNGRSASHPSASQSVTETARQSGSPQASPNADSTSAITPLAGVQTTIESSRFYVILVLVGAVAGWGLAFHLRQETDVVETVKPPTEG
jgi:hypothetical protein